MLLKQPSQLAEFMTAEATGIRKQYRREPELRVAFRLLHMDVRWLAILSTPEVEPEPGNTKDGWHVEEFTLRPVGTHEPGRRNSAVRDQPETLWMAVSHSFGGQSRTQ